MKNVFLSFYQISFYRNIAILCVKMSRVNKALTGNSSDYENYVFLVGKFYSCHENYLAN